MHDQVSLQRQQTAMTILIPLRTEFAYLKSKKFFERMQVGLIQTSKMQNVVQASQNFRTKQSSRVLKL